MATKARRKYEIREYYWKITLYNTDIHKKSYRDKLKFVKFVIDRNKTAKKSDKISYSDVQEQFIRRFPSKQVKEKKITYKKLLALRNGTKGERKRYTNITLNARKNFNDFVKLGFTLPKFAGYNKNLYRFLNARTERHRDAIMMQILRDNAHFDSSHTKDKPAGHLDLLSETLTLQGKLCDDDIAALMLTKPIDVKRGYLTTKELKKGAKKANRQHPKDGTKFHKDVFLSKAKEAEAEAKDWTVKKKNGVPYIKSRKYNQIGFLKGRLEVLDDITIGTDGCVHFTVDAKREGLTKEKKREVRDPFSHSIYRTNLKEESAAVYGKPACMVEEIPYPTLTASHIKPWKICDNEFKTKKLRMEDHEGYDPDNGLYIQSTLDDMFDKGWITFADDGEIILSEYLDEETKKKWKGARINPVFLNPERKKFLEWNRDNRFKDNRN